MKKMDGLDSTVSQIKDKKILKHYLGLRLLNIRKHNEFV